MIYIAIIEDNKMDAQRMLTFLDKYEKEHKTALQCRWFSSAEKLLEEDTHRFDIAFVDIELPGINGMDAAVEIRKTDKDITLIFVTNLAQYAMKGYLVDALDYVLKPIQYPAFQLKLQKALQVCTQNRTAQYIMITVNEGIFRIDVADIEYIEIFQHHIRYETVAGAYNGYGTLRKVEESLPRELFFRCNNHTIVGIDYVQDLLQNGDVKVGNRTFEVTKRRKKELMELLHHHYSI